MFLLVNISSPHFNVMTLIWLSNFARSCQMPSSVPATISATLLSLTGAPVDSLALIAWKVQLKYHFHLGTNSFPQCLLYMHIYTHTSVQFYRLAWSVCVHMPFSISHCGLSVWVNSEDILKWRLTKGTMLSLKFFVCVPHGCPWIGVFLLKLLAILMVVIDGKQLRGISDVQLVECDSLVGKPLTSWRAECENGVKW